MPRKKGATLLTQLSSRKRGNTGKPGPGKRLKTGKKITSVDLPATSTKPVPVNRTGGPRFPTQYDPNFKATAATTRTGSTKPKPTRNRTPASRRPAATSGPKFRSTAPAAVTAQTLTPPTQTGGGSLRSRHGWSNYTGTTKGGTAKISRGKTVKSRPAVTSSNLPTISDGGTLTPKPAVKSTNLKSTSKSTTTSPLKDQRVGAVSTSSIRSSAVARGGTPRMELSNAQLDEVARKIAKRSRTA